MNTIDMMKYSEEDDMAYESSFGTYDKQHGFQISEYGMDCFEDDSDKFLKMILKDDTIWHPQPEQPKKMTKEEIEKELGYKVEITDGKEKNKPIKVQFYNPGLELLKMFGI